MTLNPIPGGKSAHFHLLFLIWHRFLKQFISKAEFNPPRELRSSRSREKQEHDGGHGIQAQKFVS